jgi:hypothetical protein
MGVLPIVAVILIGTVAGRGKSLRIVAEVIRPGGLTVVGQLPAGIRQGIEDHLVRLVSAPAGAEVHRPARKRHHLKLTADAAHRNQLVHYLPSWALLLDWSSIMAACSSASACEWNPPSTSLPLWKMPQRTLRRKTRCGRIVYMLVI